MVATHACEEFSVVEHYHGKGKPKFGFIDKNAVKRKKLWNFLRVSSSWTDASWRCPVGMEQRVEIPENFISWCGYFNFRRTYSGTNTSKIEELIVIMKINKERKSIFLVHKIKEIKRLRIAVRLFAWKCSWNSEMGNVQTKLADMMVGRSVSL